MQRNEIFSPWKSLHVYMNFPISDVEIKIRVTCVEECHMTRRRCTALSVSRSRRGLCSSWALPNYSGLWRSDTPINSLQVHCLLICYIANKVIHVCEHPYQWAHHSHEYAQPINWRQLQILYGHIIYSSRSPRHQHQIRRSLQIGKHGVIRLSPLMRCCLLPKLR